MSGRFLQTFLLRILAIAALFSASVFSSSPVWAEDEQALIGVFQGLTTARPDQIAKTGKPGVVTLKGRTARSTGKGTGRVLLPRSLRIEFAQMIARIENDPVLSAQWRAGQTVEMQIMMSESIYENHPEYIDRFQEFSQSYGVVVTQVILVPTQVLQELEKDTGRVAQFLRAHASGFGSEFRDFIKKPSRGDLFRGISTSTFAVPVNHIILATAGLSHSTAAVLATAMATYTFFQYFAMDSMDEFMSRKFGHRWKTETKRYYRKKLDGESLVETDIVRAGFREEWFKRVVEFGARTLFFGTVLAGASVSSGIATTVITGVGFGAASVQRRKVFAASSLSSSSSSSSLSSSAESASPAETVETGKWVGHNQNFITLPIILASAAELGVIGEVGGVSVSIPMLSIPLIYGAWILSMHVLKDQHIRFAAWQEKKMNRLMEIVSPKVHTLLAFMGLVKKTGPVMECQDLFSQDSSP